MRRMWKHKWLVMIGTLTIFLSVGAVAWAATGDQTAPGNGPTGTQCTGADCTGSECTGVECTGTDCTEADCAAQAGEVYRRMGQRPGPGLSQEAIERRQERMERRQAFMEALRDDMTPEDQAKYDALVAQAKQKREALQAARQDLAGTLKELRTLADKYLDLDAADNGG